MLCNYNSFIQIINFHGLFRNALRCRKNWCLPNTGALTVHYKNGTEAIHVASGVSIQP